jgi:hypothetical protein
MQERQHNQPVEVVEFIEFMEFVEVGGKKPDKCGSPNSPALGTGCLRRRVGFSLSSRQNQARPRRYTTKPVPARKMVSNTMTWSSKRMLRYRPSYIVFQLSMSIGFPLLCKPLEESHHLLTGDGIPRCYMPLKHFGKNFAGL